MKSLLDQPEVSESEKFIFTHSGTVDSEIISTILSQLEDTFNTHNVPVKLRKKLFLIALEVLQNQQKHGENPEKNKTLGTNSIFRISKEKDHYCVTSGNLISNARVPNCQQQLERINKTEPRELKSQFKKMLVQTSLSVKGGANLGLIEMARKSGSKFIYSFNRVNPGFSFFKFQLYLKHDVSL